MQRRGVRRGCAHRGLHVSTRSKRRSVSADLLKAFDDTRPERHRLIRWWCISSARAGLIRTIVTAHQPVARWLAPTEIFAVLSWSRSLSDDLAFRRKKRVHTSQRSGAGAGPTPLWGKRGGVRWEGRAKVAQMWSPNSGVLVLSSSSSVSSVITRPHPPK